MCIAILKTKNGNITDEYLYNCFVNNKDGAGIAYTLNNKLVIKKGIFDLQEFINEIRNAESICDNNMLIHCRERTCGEINADNCHPHVVIEDKLCLIHNGKLNIEIPEESTLSDTKVFIDRCLNTKDEKIVNDVQYMPAIQTLTGEKNKFIFLNNLGEYEICNENTGVWEDGCWYSNLTYSYNMETTPCCGQCEACTIAINEIKRQIKILDLEDCIKIGDNPYADLSLKIIVKNKKYHKEENLVKLSSLNGLKELYIKHYKELQNNYNEQLLLA